LLASDGLGLLLLLAAAHETGLLRALLAALPSSSSLQRLLPLTRLRLLLTLLFLCAVGLRRTWDLRAYTGSALACVSGRLIAYGYRSTERFLAQLAKADADGPLSDALARWTHQLWSSGCEARPFPPAHQLSPPADDPFEPPTPARTLLYIDSHRKPVYTDETIPRGRIGRSGRVEKARTLICLHDAEGHVLLIHTARGDAHLIHHTPRILEHYAQATGQKLHAAVVIDREGMGASFLLTMLLSGHHVITCLRSDQYDGLASFTDVGAFAPLTVAADGTLIREVASARYQMSVPEQDAGSLTLQVALIRDWSHMQPVAADGELAWDADLEGAEGLWWLQDWQAPAAPARPREPRLFPIVSTDLTLSAEALVQLYRGRWPRQENVFKDWLLPLQLDCNHGYRKTPIPNSEVAKQRAELAAHEKTLNGRIALSRTRLHAALSRQQRAVCAQQAYAAAVLQGKADEDEERSLRQEQRRKRAVAAYDGELGKLEGYCRELREVRRTQAELEAKEQPMYELETRKDQIMTVMKVAMCNLGMYVRDRYFGPSYARASWRRLRPFFELGGAVHLEGEQLCVTLRPFNDRQLNRDLHELCAKVTAQPPRLPDGRRLVLEIQSEHRPYSKWHRRC
jgi:hypothetical protein